MLAPITPEARQAARLTRLPGVTIAEASRRTGVPPREISRARKDPDSWPDRTDLVVAALSRYGELRVGDIGDVASIARFVDWQNHDGSTAEDIRLLLDDLVAAGALAISAGRWRLLVDWPPTAPRPYPPRSPR